MITVTVAGNRAYYLHGFRTAPAAAPPAASDNQVRYVETVALEADRVRKLLAKAEADGVTPPDAEALTAKAAELMAWAGIDQALLAAARPETDASGAGWWTWTTRGSGSRRTC
jgi:hypothetical protein